MENYLYNPDQKNRTQLKNEFVIRTAILDDIMHDLENSDMTKPEQHYLLVGQRGTGKTTLLLRLRYAIEDSEKLNGWLIPISFNEEQYNVTELADLWRNIAEFLEDNYDFEGLVDEMENFYGNDDFEEKCYDALENALKLKNKKTILLIDNIGDLFKKFDEKEVRRLREILQTKKYIRLIAGSPFYLDTVLDYSQPFFEFFKVKRLEGLNEEEARTLLRKLGDIYGEREKIERIIEETPQRIETLRILTSGVPRTIALLFQIFIDHEHESSLKDLMRVLDAVTPLYKHRMDDLPTQQQKIVDAVARNWDAISVKELNAKLKIGSKIISAQLRQLEKNQVIEKRGTNSKNHIYLLQDRFWNIWYLMRNGRRKESERVVWLVRFLESWCSDDDFEERILTYVHQIREGKLDDITKVLYGQVYSSLKNLTGRQKFLLKNHIDKSISGNIIITEEEAKDEAEKLYSGGHELEALKALIEVDTASYKYKEYLDNWIKSKEFGFLRTSILSLTEDEYFDLLYEKEGHLVIILDFFTRTIFFDLSEGTFEDIPEAFGLIERFISFTDSSKLDYEYSKIGDLIFGLLFYKQTKLALLLFDKLEAFGLKDILKAHYYSSIYFDEGKMSDKLKKFGSETKDTAVKIIKYVQDYWKRNP